MKRKLLLPIALLGATLALASCSASGLDATRQKSTIRYDEVVHLTELDGYGAGYTLGSVKEFVNAEGNSYQYLNVDTGKIVLKTTSALTEHEFYLTGKSGDTTTVYDLSGNALVSTNGKVSLSGNGLFLFVGDRAFCNDSLVGIREIKNYKPFKPLPVDVSEDSIKITPQYTYVFDTQRSSARIYDAEFNFKSEWQDPLCDLHLSVDYSFLLNSGDIIYQYANRRPSNDTRNDYDFISDGAKYDLHTEIYHVVTGTTQKLDVDYVITSVSNKFSGPSYAKFYSDNVPNVARIYYIKDGRLDSNSYRRQLVTMNDDGSVVGRLDDVVDAQDGVATSVPDTNYYIVDTLEGAMLLVERGGRVVGDITATSAMTTEYIVINGGIYDYRLNKLYDLSATSYCVAYGDILLIIEGAEGTVNHYFFRNGAAIEIETFENYYFEYNYYYVKENGAYSYYNDDGKLLLQTETVLYGNGTSTSKYKLMEAYPEGGTEYYLFAPKAN